MRAIAVALASLVLAGGSLATFDVCQAGATDVFSLHACCSTAASPRRRRLVSRTDLCTDGSTPCCTEKKPGPPVVSSGGTTDLQCGRKYDPVSDPQDVPEGVTYTIAPCPDVAQQICLHVHFTAATSQIIDNIHLAILDGNGNVNSLPKGLGNWPHYDCSFSGNQGDCWVPVSVVLAVLDPTSTSLCGQDIIVAAGISISSGPTCFGRGTPIGDPDAGGRWFMYTKVAFTCPDTCTHSCCCPTQPEVHSCDLGTAYGYKEGSAITFDGHLTPQNCKHWGWYFYASSSTLTSGLSGQLILGAGGNNVASGKPVGTFSATLSGNTLTVSYSLSGGHGYDLSEVHIYASCDKPDSCAPGSYGYPVPTPDLSGPSDTSFQTTITVASCANYYLIFHAKVSQTLPVATPCPTPVT